MRREPFSTTIALNSTPVRRFLGNLFWLISKEPLEYVHIAKQKGHKTVDVSHNRGPRWLSFGFPVEYPPKTKSKLTRQMPSAKQNLTRQSLTQLPRARQCQTKTHKAKPNPVVQCQTKTHKANPNPVVQLPSAKKGYNFFGEPCFADLEKYFPHGRRQLGTYSFGPASPAIEGGS